MHRHTLDPPQTLSAVADGEREHRLRIRRIDAVDEIVVALRLVARFYLGHLPVMNIVLREGPCNYMLSGDWRPSRSHYRYPRHHTMAKPLFAAMPWRAIGTKQKYRDKLAIESLSLQRLRLELYPPLAARTAS